MELRKVRHLIANFRRHYNLNGDDILACYDTALVALFGYHTVDYVTISISPAHWKRLVDKLDLDAQVKHPGSGIPCLKLFNRLYVRSETRVDDSDVVWSKNTHCYTPTAKYLGESFQRILMSSRITKKQMEHANRLVEAHSRYMVKI